MIAVRVLKFLMEPDESMCVDPGEDDDEDEEEEEDEIEEEEEDENEADEEEYNVRNERNVRGGVGSGDSKRRNKPMPRSGRASSGRPKRSTAGKSNSNKNTH